MVGRAQEQQRRSARREQLALQHILKAIRKVRFGVVTVIVQDGLVVQIDQTEKTRIDYAREMPEDGNSG